MAARHIYPRVEELIRTAADTIIMPRFGSLTGSDIQEKSPGDLVTIADQEAEEFLRVELTQLLPGSVLVGEEGVAADPDSINLLLGDDPVWVVDPVDGTHNFVNGSETFAVMVALVVSGRTEASWIFKPVPGSMHSAIRGIGAFRNGEPMAKAPDPKALPQLGGTLKRKYLPADIRSAVDRGADSFGSVDYGQFCAAAEYVELAEHRSDFLLYWRVNPWDHLAGALLVAETGGVARYFDGTEYSYQAGRPGVLAVANRHSWDGAAGVLFEGLESL